VGQAEGVEVIYITVFEEKEKSFGVHQLCNRRGATLFFEEPIPCGFQSQLGIDI